MTSEQAFEILGISDRNIDEAGLKKAFYEAARLTHPDSNPEDENAQYKFKMIKDAYSLLDEYVKKEDGRNVKSAEKSNSRESADRAGNVRYAKSSNKDTWDYYEEADRKFARERHEKARQRAEETIKRRAEFERRKYQESIKAEEERKYKQQQAVKQQAEHKQAEHKQAEHKQAEHKQAEPRQAREQRHITGFVELVGFSILSLVTIAQLLFMAFGGKGKGSNYANTSVMIVWWIVSVQLGYRMMQFVKGYMEDRIIPFLVLLLATEGGLGIYKVGQMLLKGTSWRISCVVMLILAFLFQLINVGKIAEGLRSQENLERNSTLMIMIEMGICFIGGVLFILLT